MTKKTGRNAKCLCGSGKKYKHCCMNNPKAALLNEMQALFSEYSKASLLSQLASLLIIPENHAKHTRIFSAMRHTLLAKPGSRHIERNRLEDIIKLYFENNPFIAMQDDPNDNLFTELIFWRGKDYLVFPGLSEQAVYRVNILLKTLSSEKFETLNTIIAPAITGLLEISNRIGLRLKYTRYQSSDSRPGTDLCFPDGTISARAITFSQTEFQSLFIEDSAKDFIFTNYQGLKSEPEILEADSTLYKTPVINIGTEYLILPTELITAIEEYTHRKASELGVSEQLFDTYQQ